MKYIILILAFALAGCEENAPSGVCYIGHTGPALASRWTLVTDKGPLNFDTHQEMLEYIMRNPCTVKP